MHCNSITSGGRITSSAVVSNAPGRLHGIVAEADGTNAATITIYDNASAASGTILAKIIVDATLTHENLILPEVGIEANNGVYCEISGTGAAAIVYYSKG